MSQREDVHLYCPAFTSLLKLISLSRKDYCPALYILDNIDITSGRIYCPAQYILADSDITVRVYCPVLYILAYSDITSGRMYCPALYILTNSDITERILHCQGLMEFVFMLFYPGVDNLLHYFSHVGHNVQNSSIHYMGIFGSFFDFIHCYI